ncbi:DUF305 domain-containing protein [Belnapia sp. F-4-1]|uniref:DUF305 domain-containing protein n=1 Tax=Belnapia sp. F-4-1 TaxID=1545443 RepID=UPI0019174CA5|nr:DUF305 domain-containing protein [Belnapia sp. F-4-1]
MAGREPGPGICRFTRLWVGLAGMGVLGLALLALLDSRGRELPHWGAGTAFDAACIRRMAAHHAQGVGLAELGAERGAAPRLRDLARLMVAEQRGEIAILAQWHRSWFGADLPPASHEDHASMPGMLSSTTFWALRAARPRLSTPASSPP